MDLRGDGYTFFHNLFFIINLCILSNIKLLIGQDKFQGLDCLNKCLIITLNFRLALK